MPKSATRHEGIAFPAGIRQRGETAIQARFSLKGKRYERTFSSGRNRQSNLKAAIRWQTTHKQELQLRTSKDHTRVKFCNTTLEDGLKLLDLHYKEEGKTSYSGYINFLLKNKDQFPFLTIPLEDLTRRDITQFRRDLQLPYEAPAGKMSIKVQGRRKLIKKTRSRATVNKYLNVISVAIDYLNEDYDADFDNIAKRVKKLKGADKKRSRRVSDDEFEAILSHIPTQNAANVAEFFTFSLHQGTRRRETFNLRWGDIDLAHYKLTLPHHKTEAYDSDNGGQIRTLTQEAHHHIQHLKKNYIALHGQEPHPNERIFTRYQTESTYSKIFAKAAQAAGLKDIRFHDLRHEATTRISHKCRYNSNLTKTYTGHKDERSLARYSHASPREIHDAVQQLQAQGRPNIHRTLNGNYPSALISPEDGASRYIDIMKIIMATCSDEKTKAMLSEVLKKVPSLS